MSEERDREVVQRLLSTLADRLEDFLEGDELALETLAEVIEEGGFNAEDLQAAILALRSLSGAGAGVGLVTVDDPPGPGAQRTADRSE